MLSFPSGRSLRFALLIFSVGSGKKNYIDNPVIEHVSSDFKILINPDPTEMYLQKMTKFHLGSRALANIIHGVVS